MVVGTKTFILLLITNLNTRFSLFCPLLSQHSSNSLLRSKSVINQEKTGDGDSMQINVVESSETKIPADERLYKGEFHILRSYVTVRIQEELQQPEKKPFHSFLKVFEKIINNFMEDLYFKVVDKNSFIVGCAPTSIITPKGTETDLKSFIKRATRNYSMLAIKTELYTEGNACAAYCDENSTDMIICFLKGILNTSQDYERKLKTSKDYERKYLAKFNFFEDLISINSLCSRIIDLINGTLKKENLLSEKKHYPKCYVISESIENKKGRPVSHCFSIIQYTEN